ncbi:MULTISPECIES: hypothetical protein [Flavobacterium]|nr:MULTISPECIES: hypothetical protein [Flavobacterium]
MEYKKENNFDNNNFINTDSMFNLILKKQLEKGISGLLNNSFDIETYVFKKEDLEVTLPTIKNILLSNGYKTLSNEKFNLKVKKFFNRVISPDSNKNFLFSNDYDVCSKDIKFYRNDNSIDIKPFGFYIIKNNNFITELYAIPEIVNYQKEFSSIANIENSMEREFTNDKGSKVEITRWKDLPDLDQQRKKNIQTLVARNMYLFNDSKAHFKWLILNDQYFMRSLVTTFGYYDDTTLVEWVAENTKMDAQDLEPLNEVIYNKKCDGKIGFNYTFLKIISEDEEKATEKFNFLKWYYFDWLLNPKNTLELTFSQKAEIIARMHSFIYSNMNDYRTYEFMGTFAEHYDYDNTYSKEFKAKNYYNIPDFEKQWKEAKLEGDGIALPGEE